MEPDIKAYIAVMEEVKRRAEVIHGLLNEQINVMYLATHVESMVLQVRMITELVALASLAANRPLFEQNKQKFEKHWHPKEILKDVEKLNPNFYPQPIVEMPSKNPLVEVEFVDLKTGFMTRDKLIEVHGRCGNLLHARNPFGKDANYNYYKRMVPEWMVQIRKLLELHLIQPLNKNRLYRVWLKDAKDGRVGTQPFEWLGNVDDV